MHGPCIDWDGDGHLGKTCVGEDHLGTAVMYVTYWIQKRDGEQGALRSITLWVSEIVCWRNIYLPRFMVALFTVANIWTQHNYLSVDRWIKKICYIYTMNAISHKKEGNPVICTNVNAFEEEYTNTKA
jgi:hypothetical protein